MSKAQKTLILAATALMALSACASTTQSARSIPTKPEDRFPVTVDQQTVTMTVAIDKSMSDLTVVDKARLNAFVESYIVGGHGLITVTAPSGNPSDFYGQEMASDIRKELNRLGIEWDEMLGATYRVSGDADMQEVIVSFSRFVASATPCGDFSGAWIRNRANVSSKNFGCANQNNLAAMIVDPHDLIEPTPMSPADTARRTLAIDNYRKDDTTSSATEQSSQISSSSN